MLVRMLRLDSGLEMDLLVFAERGWSVVLL